MSNELLNGGVIIIGSLFWEDEHNAIPEKKKIQLAKYRRKWRENNFQLKRSEIKLVPLPVRYGRCSSSRKQTYTMVLSREYVANKMGWGLIVPFKKKFTNSRKNEITTQIKRLAKAEGIYETKKDLKLACIWGVIAIWINPNSKNKDSLEKYWGKVISNVSYQYLNYPANDFEWCDGRLIDNEYKLTLSIDTELDFLFCNYILPKYGKDDEDKNRKENMLKGYADANRIGEAILKSGYSTYFCQNKVNGIVTYDDDEIFKALTKITKNR